MCDEYSSENSKNQYYASLASKFRKDKVKPIALYLFEVQKYDYQSNRRIATHGLGERNYHQGTAVKSSQRIATLAGSQKCGKGVMR